MGYNVKSNSLFRKLNEERLNLALQDVHTKGEWQRLVKLDAQVDALMDKYYPFMSIFPALSALEELRDGPAK